MRHLATSLLLIAVAQPAAADSFELALQGGRVLPYFEQAVRYLPGGVSQPGFSLQTGDAIALDAQGGTALCASASFYAAKAIGFEARVDRAPIDVVVAPARFDLVLRPGAGIPPLLASLSATGVASIDPLTPVSLNLKLRSTGSVRIAVSGGPSYLPGFAFRVTETIALASLQGFDVGGPGLRVTAGGAFEGSLGWNAGLALEIGLGSRLALVGEARAFVFEERTIEWRPLGDRSLTATEQALVAELLRRLEPVRFRPGFYQATAGLALRF